MKSPLLTVDEMPPIQGFKLPQQFYIVARKPSLLAGMRHPQAGVPWENLYEMGFRHVICLSDDHVSYDPSPLDVLASVKLQDLFSGAPPQNPTEEEQTIREVVIKTVEALQKGSGVVVHCQGGRGRTGTVIGCVLRTLGYESREAIDYLDRLHKARGKPGWPESSWQANLVEKFRVNKE